METTLDRTETLKVGDVAPDFSLRDQDGNSVSLSDYRGKKNVVLVFHPLAFTSICSTQMPGYNKELQTFEGLETQVLGLSVDSSPAHRAWAEMLGGIDYPMLADFYPHGEVARKYGILRPEGISERATFVIDKEGKVRSIEVHDIGTLPDHQKMLETLRSIQ
jgi:peroxiredoxin